MLHLQSRNIEMQEALKALEFFISSLKGLEKGVKGLRSSEGYYSQYFPLNTGRPNHT